MQRSKKEILIELLVLQAQAGDRRAATDLVEIWNPSVLHYANRLLNDWDDSKDVSQESWLSIIKSLDRLRDAATFPAWSLRIVHHKTTDLIRNRIRERQKLSDFREHSVRQTKSNRKLSSTLAETSRQMDQQIHSLPVEDRKLLVLFYQQGLSVAAIAQQTERSAAAVKSKLFQLRQRIKANIERHNHE